MEAMPTPMGIVPVRRSYHLGCFCTYPPHDIDYLDHVKWERDGAKDRAKKGAYVTVDPTHTAAVAAAWSPVPAVQRVQNKAMEGAKLAKQNLVNNSWRCHHSCPGQCSAAR